MTPKEKAHDLVNTYWKWARMDGFSVGSNAKQCALIAVDEIINTIEEVYGTFEERKFWNEVKQEIEKL